MNILPHKSWHVRTKKNIERVRRDEEKAAIEEKEKQRRVALAEQEVRTETLRAKIRQKSILEKPENTISEEAVPQQTHINFFSAIQKEEESSNRKNKEHEAEEKAKQEEWEKKIGLLNYLGQSAVESHTVPPWYLDKKHKKQEAICSEKKQKLNDMADPLHEMEKYLKDKHHKKHKHDEKKKKKKSKMKALSSSESPKVSLEQLRAERLRRENKEKEKAKQLFAKLNKESVPEKKGDTIIVSDRDRQYSSQYNPSLARQNKPRN